MERIKQILYKFKYLSKYSDKQLNTAKIITLRYDFARIFRIIINNTDNYVIKYILNIKHNIINNEYLIINNIKKSDHIVEIYEYLEDNRYIFYLMEFIDNNIIKNINNINIIKNIKNMILCLQNFHTNNIIHLDIKKENFVYDSKLNIYKLIDFELSQKNTDEIFNMAHMFGNNVKYPDNFITTGKLGFYIDIWSVGIMIYDIIYNNRSLNKKNIYFDKKFEYYNKLILFILNNYNNLSCKDILEYIELNYKYYD